MTGGTKRKDGRHRSFAGKFFPEKDSPGKNGKELLPGLPNETVLAQIVPKLTGRAFNTLSSVSPSWLEAIRNRKVYDARVSSHSTETLVVLNHNHPDSFSIHAISLYSVRDDSWKQLPKFPFSKRGIPRACQCVSLDGKLYVLGGDPKESHDDDSDDSGHSDNSGDSDDDRSHAPGIPDVPREGNEVYVLDLVEQTGWKQCENMPEPRFDFGCGVIDGKIYIFGGVRVGPQNMPGGPNNFVRKMLRSYASESFVYDPKENVWSSIESMTSKRSDHHVVPFEDELFVHGGNFGPRREALFSEVYNPKYDEWTNVEPFDPESLRKGRLFTAKGKLYLMTFQGIYERVESSTASSMEYCWTLLHSLLFTDLDPEDGEEFEVVATQAVDGEVLALISSSDARETQTGLLRSKGFGSEEEEIEFELVDCDLLGGPEHQWYPHLMCPIQL